VRSGSGLAAQVSELGGSRFFGRVVFSSAIEDHPLELMHELSRDLLEQRNQREAALRQVVEIRLRSDRSSALAIRTCAKWL
jgi:hypothetical protein